MTHRTLFRRIVSNDWYCIAILLLFIIALIILPGCNTVSGFVTGIQRDFTAMQQAQRDHAAGGPTSRRMRELGWNDDHLLSHPSYGEPMRP